MKKFVLALIVSLIFSINAEAQTLEATVNRNPVPQGEAFILSLVLKDGQTNMTPDISPLNKDFKVYSVSNATNIQIINGKRSESKQWDIGLIASKSGEVEIPALTLGNLSSAPIKMKVLDANQALQSSSSAPAASGADAPKFAMKAKVDNKNPYVQQQVTYTLSIFDAGGLQGLEPQFIQENQDDWIIRGIGEPQVKTKIVNGRSMREIVLQYALFPQKSGTLKTPDVRFEGFYLTKGKRGHDPFAGLFDDAFGSSAFGFADMFATRNPIVLQAEPIALNVKPIPAANGNNWWLPAENVELYAEWDPARPTFKDGEAVTRNIYLKAQGVIENQLPSITFSESSKLKQYPEKPVTETAVDNGQIISVKKTANVYIPNGSGEAVIPAVEIPWFNVLTGKPEKAILPAEKITILPTAGNAVDSKTSSEVSPVQQAPAFQPTSQASEVSKENADAQNFPGSIMMYLYVAAAFVLGILLTYLLLRPGLAKEAKKEKIKNYPSYIAKAARKKDFRGLRDALTEWAAQAYPDKKILNLKDVGQAVNDKEFEKEIQILMNNLYAEKDDTAWDPENFIKAFEKVYKRHGGQAKKTPVLPDLYHI